MHACETRNVPRVLIWCIRSKRFMSVASVPVSWMALALLTQMSMPPKRAGRPRRTAPPPPARPTSGDSLRRVSDLTPAANVAAPSRALDALTRRLRVECPWDREQDERTIVPHTVEEAYELAEAAHARRRRQAARRARRRPLPGPLPLAAARGARRRLAGRGRRALRAEADPPPPARLRRRSRSSTRAARSCATGTRSSTTEHGREPGIFGEVPENLPAAAVRAQAPAPRGVDRASTSTQRALRGGRRRARRRSRAPATATDRDARFARRRRPAVRRGQRRAQAEGRPGARAARPRPIAFRARVEAAEGSPRPTARPGTT